MSTTNSMPSNRFLFITVFIAGMCTLAIEFVTSRVIQIILGTSNLVWANVIGLVLLFLTLGYFIGGRLADKNPKPSLFYSLITIAGCSAVFSLLLTSTLLRATASVLATAEAGPLVVAMITVTMAMAIPVTILGCISPFAIRLAVNNVGDAGSVSGKIYAISTLGSLAGTYASVLYVIPTAGSRVAAVIFGSILILTGIIGILRFQGSKRVLVLPVLLIPFIYIWVGGKIKDTPRQIYETESAYNYIQVIKKENGCVSLQLNESASEHSAYCPDKVVDFSTFMMSAMAVFFTPVSDFDKDNLIESALIVGSAAGTQADIYNHLFGDIEIDGIEIDPKILEVGSKYFAMDEIPNFTTYVGDGRYVLNTLDKQYDQIVIDAYKPPYIPWHLTTVEFFEEAKARLTERGTVTLNVLVLAKDYTFVEAVTATLLEVFASVHTVQVTPFNVMLVATQTETKFNDMNTNRMRLAYPIDPNMKKLITRTLAGKRKTRASDVIFTDEVAPVEPMIDSMMLRQVAIMAGGG